MAGLVRACLACVFPLCRGMRARNSPFRPSSLLPLPALSCRFGCLHAYVIFLMSCFQHTPCRVTCPPELNFSRRSPILRPVQPDPGTRRDHCAFVTRQGDVVVWGGRHNNGYCPPGCHALTLRSHPPTATTSSSNKKPQMSPENPMRADPRLMTTHVYEPWSCLY